MASMDTKNFDLLVNQFGFLYQYMFNSLHLNNGRNIFYNVAQMAGVAKTDWSWSALMEDFNHDGLRDIFVTNGYRKYGTDNDFKAKVSEAKLKYNNQVPLEVKEELYNSIPSEKLANNIFSQTSNLKFEEKNTTWGLDIPTFSNGAAHADLDNDGDLDLIVSNIDDEALVLENRIDEIGNSNFLNVHLPSDEDQYSKVIITYDGMKQVGEIRRVRGYMSSVQPIVHFGLGNIRKIDRLEIIDLDGQVHIEENIEANQTLTFDQGIVKQNATDSKLLEKVFNPLPPVALGLNFNHIENDYNDFAREVLLPYKQSMLGPAIATADLNGDGVDDFFFGGASGQAGRFFISEGERYREQRMQALEADAQYEDMSALFVDLELDGDMDLVVISGGNEWPQGSSMYLDRVYRQNASGIFEKESSPSLEDKLYSGGIVKSIDFDGDGDHDIIIGNRIIPQTYPHAAASFIFENEDGVLKDVTQTVFPQLESYGIINDIEIEDFDNDGWDDVVLAGEWEAPEIYKNSKGVFSKEESVEFPKGLWFSISIVDVDLNGKKDILFGNIGENYKLKASADSPLRVYSGDLDGTGTHDLVLSTSYKGSYVPVRGKECSTEQMPFIEEKFKTYESFASSSLIDIYGKETLNQTHFREITTTSHKLYLNEGNFRFRETTLPREIQAFPLFDTYSTDLNGDTQNDIIAIGAIYQTEVETPRLDAGGGMVLLNLDGKLVKGDGAVYNIFVQGDVRKIVPLKGRKEKNALLITRNNGPLALYEY